MQLKIISEKESPLLGRKELELEASFEKATPSEAETKKEIASAIKIKEDLISIKKIHQLFGTKKAKIVVHIYNNVEQLKKLEDKKEKKKQDVKDEKKKEG